MVGERKEVEEALVLLLRLVDEAEAAVVARMTIARLLVSADVRIVYSER